MIHYVCRGSCGGDWPKPGLCDAAFCSKEGQPLVECNCEDGMHQSVVEETPSTDPDPNELGDDFV